MCVPNTKLEKGVLTVGTADPMEINVCVFCCVEKLQLG